MSGGRRQRRHVQLAPALSAACGIARKLSRCWPPRSCAQEARSGPSCRALHSAPCRAVTARYVSPPRVLHYSLQRCPEPQDRSRLPLVWTEAARAPRQSLGDPMICACSWLLGGAEMWASLGSHVSPVSHNLELLPRQEETRIRLAAFIRPLCSRLRSRCSNACSCRHPTRPKPHPPTMACCALQPMALAARQARPTAAQQRAAAATPAAAQRRRQQRSRLPPPPRATEEQGALLCALAPDSWHLNAVLDAH